MIDEREDEPRTVRLFSLSRLPPNLTTVVVST